MPNPPTHHQHDPEKLANVFMTISKVCSGLNQNALRYLQPLWMDAWSGVLMRLGFAGAAFWIMNLFTAKKAPVISRKDKLTLLAIGFFLIYGYMICLLLGLTYSTPISASLILCVEPVWVLLLAAIFFHKRPTGKEILGMGLGIAGALLCILTQKADELATNPLLGNSILVGGSLFYAIYLVASKKLLSRLDAVNFNKWSFTGGALAAFLVVFFHGFHAPVLASGFSTPMLVLLFVLVIPSTVSYLLMAYAIKRLSATAVAMYGYLILIVSMAASYALGQDHFSWFQPVAVVLIVISVYLVEIAGKKKTP